METFNRKSRLSQIIQLIVTVTCSIIFILLAKNQFKEFVLEPTGTSMKLKLEKDLNFPAFTLCDCHYENRKMQVDAGRPGNFFQKPKLVMSNPLAMYQTLNPLNIDIISSIWKYYFTLVDKVLIDDKRAVLFKGCRVGSKSCNFIRNSWEIPLPTKLHERPAIEVEAGTWTSFLLADSDHGNTYLCHTLVPNVTVDFSGTGGNSIAVSFDNSYQRTSLSWKLYVHDKHEHVTLDTFALDSLSHLTFTKYDENDEFKTRKKAMIIPRKFILPEPSDVLPCNKSEKYSQAWCQIKWGWERKLDAMKHFYGEKFKCQLPGIWTNESYRLPLCDHYDSSQVDDGSLGFREITSPVDTGEDHHQPKLTYPPIGNFKETSNCLQRCTYYTYELQQDGISDFDDLLYNNDVYLYFPSKTVEIWTDYRLYTPLDFFSSIGGTLGLTLGMSLLSIILF